MRTSTYGPGRFAGRISPHFTTTGMITAIVGRWRQYRMMRDMDSLPYDVMKDIGFRAAEQTNAK
jgi:hypothetical protein